jgi:molecular chaperone GrpE
MSFLKHIKETIFGRNQSTMEQNKSKIDSQENINTEENIENTTSETIENNTTDNTAAEQTDSQPADETNKLKAEVAELKDKYLRIYSEFDNYRKRTAKEKIELSKAANEELMVALLPVLDDFERALKSFEKVQDIEAVKEGVKLVHNKFTRTLENKGLKPMEAIGNTFDADQHEGITQIPAPSDDMKGKVVDEVEKGYYLNEKLIRFAKVVIGA